MSARPIVTFLDGANRNTPIGGAQTIAVRFVKVPNGAPGSKVGRSPSINLILSTKRQGRFGLR